MAEVSIRKFITVEMMVAMLVFAFSSGGLWFSLTDRAEATEAKTKEMAEVQVEMQKSMSQIETDIAVIKANQSASDRRSRRQEITMDRVLDILQKD